MHNTIHNYTKHPIIYIVRGENNTDLNNKGLFMGATSLCRKLILQTAAFFVQLHHWILALFGQNGTLASLLKSKRSVQYVLLFGVHCRLRKQKRHTSSEAFKAVAVAFPTSCPSCPPFALLLETVERPRSCKTCKY